MISIQINCHSIWLYRANLQTLITLQSVTQQQMSNLEQGQVEISSESDPQDLDLDLINDIKVDQHDLLELDKLISTTKNQFEARGIAQVRPEGQAVDAFLRNFFIKNKMNDTLNNFQQEWYELAQQGTIVEGAQKIPLQYEESQKIKDQIRRLKQQLDKAIIVAEKARGTYQKLLKQKNFYKMHHQRVQQEKKKLNYDLEKLRNNHIVFEKKYDQMADKYSHLMKEKMLIKLERDRLKTRAQIQREITQNAPVSVTSQQQKGTTDKFGKTKDKVKFTPFPPDQRINPYAQQEISSFQYKNTILYKTWKPHNMTITSIDLHPKKPVLATASDDLSFKLMTVPQGELIMSGEGHKQWVSGVKFHPKGLHLLTSSGDSLIKLWDIANYSCIQTFKDHTQAVWDIDFHDTGDFFVSGSMDHLAKIFDVNVGKCRSSLRGHVDSVNAVHFQPYSNIVATASADKTVSLWDLKTSLCVQTFFGHNNAVNDVAFNLIGDKIVSCDADGIVKIWDVRMVKEKQQFDSGPYAANAVDFDVSGTIVGIGLDKGEIKIYNQAQDRVEVTLKGHEDSVQDIVFDKKSKSIFSCGADCTFRIWQ